MSDPLRRRLSASPWLLVGLGLFSVALPALLRSRLPNPEGDLVLLLLFSAWGAFVSVDERAFGPLLFHEPLAAAGVAGLLIGRLPEGVLFGVTFQLVWPGLRPMGGSRLPSGGLGALVALAWYMSLPEEAGVWGFPIALGAGVAAAAWGQSSEDWLRRRNGEREARTLPGGAAWSGDSLIAAGAAEALARGLLGIGLLAGIPLLLLRLVAWKTIQPAEVLANLLPPGATSWSELMPPEPGLAPLWLFAGGGIVRQGVRSWKESRGEPRAAAPPASRKEAATQFDAPRGEMDTGSPKETAGPLASGAGQAPQAAASLPASLWLRLLLVQAGFSRAYLQRSGFRALVEALQRRDAGGKSSRNAAALAEDLSTGPALNTHPAMAAALLGAWRSILAARGDPPRPPRRLAEVGGPVLAQWGDRLFWGGFRPLLALLAIAAAPLHPAAALAGFLVIGCGLELRARDALHGWGFRHGWSIVGGSIGRFWRTAPARAARLHGIVGIISLLLLAAGAGYEPNTTAWAIRAGWLMLGYLAGRTAIQRAMLWGWMGWGVSLAASALALWAPAWVV